MTQSTGTWELQLCAPTHCPCCHPRAPGKGPGAQLGSPLTAALRVGNLEMARELLERGASLHTLGPAGDTVLHSAMVGGPAALRPVLGAMQQRLTRAQRRQLF